MVTQTFDSKSSTSLETSGGRLETRQRPTGSGRRRVTRRHQAGELIPFWRDAQPRHNSIDETGRAEQRTRLRLQHLDDLLRERVITDVARNAEMARQIERETRRDHARGVPIPSLQRCVPGVLDDESSVPEVAEGEKPVGGVTAIHDQEAPVGRELCAVRKHRGEFVAPDVRRCARPAVCVRDDSSRTRWSNESEGITAPPIQRRPGRS